jgi:hypothetical protein
MCWAVNFKEKFKTLAIVITCFFLTLQKQRHGQEKLPADVGERPLV